MIELKPCPFCGGGATLIQGDARLDFSPIPDGYGGFYRVDSLAYDWNVSCKKCGSTGIVGTDKIFRKQSGEMLLYHDGMTEAIDAWNRRDAE